ncbi:MAG: hypothetical protein V1865_03045 [bacterium]
MSKMRKRISRHFSSKFEDIIYFFDRKKEYRRWRTLHKIIMLPNLKEYFAAQKKEIFSDDNIHYTKENLGIDNPTEEQLLENYMNYKAHIRFRKEHAYPGQPRDIKFLKKCNV